MTEKLAHTTADDGSDASIELIGARVNNLKNIDVSIPHRSLTVITGLSGIYALFLQE